MISSIFNSKSTETSARLEVIFPEARNPSDITHEHPKDLSIASLEDERNRKKLTGERRKERNLIISEKPLRAKENIERVDDDDVEFVVSQERREMERRWNSEINDFLYCFSVKRRFALPPNCRNEVGIGSKSSPNFLIADSDVGRFQPRLKWNRNHSTRHAARSEKPEEKSESRSMMHSRLYWSVSEQASLG